MDANARRYHVIGSSPILLLMVLPVTSIKREIGESDICFLCFFMILGGAAITNKNELESINETNLKSVCLQLREAMMPQSENGIGMDWSRRNGNEIELGDVSKIGESSLDDLNSNFIVVHGAG